MKKFYFGYDIDNVRRVEDYVKKNFSSTLFTLHKGYGDDVMNALDIYDEVDDVVLFNLIKDCDGEGDYWE